jgi:hypothetical protein
MILLLRTPKVKKRIGTRLASYPSSVPWPLPASGSVCDSPLPPAPPPALPLDVLGPVAGGFPLAFAVAAAPGLTAEVPGLAARSLGFNKLLKKFCSSSCCVGLGALLSIGDVGAPVHLPRPPSVLLLPSTSASTRSTVGSEKADESKCPTRPAAGAADGSVGVRKMRARVAIGASCVIT